MVISLAKGLDTVLKFRLGIGHDNGELQDGLNGRAERVPVTHLKPARAIGWKSWTV